MADFYTHVSFTIRNLTREEFSWWGRVRDICYDLAGEEEDVEETLTPEQLEIAKAISTGGVYDWGVNVGVTAPITNVLGQVWISDDGGNPNLDSVANVIQIFLQKFRPESLITFRWAETCSSPRTDAFGGGVFAVTAKEVRALTAFSAEENARRSFEETGFVDFHEAE